MTGESFGEIGHAVFTVRRAPDARQQRASDRQGPDGRRRPMRASGMFLEFTGQLSVYNKVRTLYLPRR